MSDIGPSINPNTADQQELILLPGVGEALAQRIIERRPFDSIEDLQRVPGLGESTLDRIRPMIALKEQDVPEGSREDSVPEVGAGGEPDRSEFMTRSQVLGVSAAMAGVGVIVSILLVLAIFIGVNRTLNYSRHEAVRTMASDVTQIEVELEGLAGTLDGVEERLQALEGLSGRMAELEAETQDLAGDVAAASAQVQSMRTRIGDISIRIDEVARQSQNQATFFERLQSLLTELFGGPVEEGTQ
ncbi:MAG: helix-hairpin-helix domain-containing protein [Anaerolineales bacterium]|jgi:competence ComEA-like helix-hairpin-helix protein